MHRFAVVALLLVATAASSHTLTGPQLLTDGTRVPSLRKTTTIASARAGDGFVVVWKEDAVVRIKRLSRNGDVLFETAIETPHGPGPIAFNGGETLVALGSTAIRIHADGRITPAPPEYVPVWSLVPFEDGYLATASNKILRLDLDGRPVAQASAPVGAEHIIGATGQIAMLDGKPVLVWLANNVLHASVVGSDLQPAPDVVLTGDVDWETFSATADRGGELAVATHTTNGYAIFLFDSLLRGRGRIAMPPLIPAPVLGIAWTGGGYVTTFTIAGANTVVANVTRDGHWEVETVSVSGLSAYAPPPVSGTDGALIAAFSSGDVPRASFAIIGGSSPQLDLRLLADADPEQRWPRIARIGDRVVVTWIELTGPVRLENPSVVDAEVMAAIFDPIGGRVTAGPVAIANSYVADSGNELAVASNGSSIAIVVTTEEFGLSGQFVLLSPSLQTIVSTFTYDSAHDVAWDGSAYVVAEGARKLSFEHFDATGKRMAGSDQINMPEPVSGYFYTDGRLSLGTSDALLIVHNWYQLLCWCGEGPWHIEAGRVIVSGHFFGQPETLANASLYDVKKKMSGFARTADHVFFFFPKRTEVRAGDTLALLKTIPNDALTKELPYRSIGQAAVVGNEIVGTFGSVLEFFALDATPIGTLPLDDSANDSQFVAGARFVIVDDAVSISGSRRINVRVLDPPAVHGRAAAH